MSEPTASVPARDPLARAPLLAAMGVISWLPRRRLAGDPGGQAWERAAPPAHPRSAAGPSGRPPRDVPDQRSGGDPVLRSKTPEATTGNGRPSASPAAEQAGQAAQPAPPDAASGTTSRDPAPRGTPTAPDPVRIEWLQVSDGLSLLFWWQGGAPDPRDSAFAADLVYATGAVPEALPDPRVFDSPRAAMLAEAGALQAAVGGFLAGLPGGRLISVGDGSAAGVRLADCLRPGVELLELPSVGDLIRNPGRKCDAWRRLATFLATR